MLDREYCELQLCEDGTHLGLKTQVIPTQQLN